MKVNLGTSKRARIEMLPLIDIVFLLLVFFIYAMLSMAVHRGVPVVLPASSTAKIDRHLILSVTIKRDGAIYLDKDQTTLKDLEAALRQKAHEKPDTGVLLFADKNVSYQRLFRVLDEIRLSGLTRVSLQAEANAQR